MKRALFEGSFLFYNGHADIAHRKRVRTPLSPSFIKRGRRIEGVPQGQFMNCPYTIDSRCRGACKAPSLDSGFRRNDGDALTLALSPAEGEGTNSPVPIFSKGGRGTAEGGVEKGVQRDCPLAGVWGVPYVIMRLDRMIQEAGLSFPDWEGQ
jgi:hypothetical protein